MPRKQLLGPQLAQRRESHYVEAAQRFLEVMERYPQGSAWWAEATADAFDTLHGCRPTYVVSGRASTLRTPWQRWGWRVECGTGQRHVLAPQGGREWLLAALSPLSTLG